VCGICGIVDLKNRPASELVVQEMMKSMKHRGPDDNGKYIHKNIGLGFVRLSILDLTRAGHQPMFSYDKRFVIVFNGEIYNYIELRQELSTKGYKFVSGTDTEVILAAYDFWGKDCLNRFNGMWAFVIFDQKTNEIFGARDRFGIKPFYYIKTNDSFFFSSEIRTLKVLKNTTLSVNDQAVFDYLTFNRTDHGEKTFYNEIYKLPHAHCFTINQNKKFDVYQWYDLESQCNKEEINADEYRELLTSSIKLRMRSDVPVGVCLSGGLDSSSIVSVLSKKLNYSEINTFSAVYGSGQTGDESEFIREFTPLLNNMHYTTPTAETLFQDIPDFIDALQEPVPSTGPYAQYKVMQLASKNVTVTLDGQGADEQLAGYHYFYGYYFKELLKSYKFGKMGSEIFHYINKHKSLLGLQTLAFFLLPEQLRLQTRVKNISYLQNNFAQSFKEENLIAGKLYGAETLQKALINHFSYKLEHLLKWEDHNAMRFSIESRVPFLDYRLVEQTLSLPNDSFINKGLTKHILRESMKNIVPEKNRLRYDKVGFDTPQDEWFRIKQFQEYIKEILISSSNPLKNYIDLRLASKLYNKHIKGEINIAKDIWKWINLHVWLDKN
jgi:asparagine synthase (glutamine-hydrolysing)